MKKPLVEITLLDDALGIMTYWIWMLTFGWIIGLLLWSVVS